MDAEAYPQEVLADEEPKYLRRQKPLEIKRRKFGRKAWSTYLRVAVWIVGGAAGSWAAYELGHFLLASPEMALVHPEQVVLTGTTTWRPRACSRFSRRTAARASCAFRSTSGAGSSKRFRGSSRPPCGGRCRTESKSKSRSGRRSHLCASASDMALVDRARRDPRTPARRQFPFSGGDRNRRGHGARRSRAAHAAFLRLRAADRSGARGRARPGQRSGSFGRARCARHADGLLASGGRRDGGNQVDAPVLVHFGDSDFAGKYQTLVEDIGAVAREGRIASSRSICGSAARLW